MVTGPWEEVETRPPSGWASSRDFKALEIPAWVLSYGLEKVSRDPDQGETKGVRKTFMVLAPEIVFDFPGQG